MAAGKVVLDIRGLTVRLPAGADRPNAVESISLNVEPGEIVCIVGESGSGKSVTAFTVMGLLPPNVLRPTAGQVLLEGEDVLSARPERLRELRGTRMAMVFQEPMTALNPVLTIGDQVDEVLRIHTQLGQRERRAKVIEIMNSIRLPDPERLYNAYPHQVSGGQRQRIMIAAALVLDPALLIADEPTTALDVTIQAQILELLQQLQERFAMSIILITHDLGVIAEMAQRVLVMYAGEIVEQASVRELFAQPHHPYTEGLLAAMPTLGAARSRLAVIPGTVPAPTRWPTGCRFHDRCRYAWERPEREHPPLFEVGDSHWSRCFLAEEPQRRHAVQAKTIAGENA